MTGGGGGVMWILVVAAFYVLMCREDDNYFENDGEYEVMIGVIIATMSDNNERSMAAGAAVASGCLRCSDKIAGRGADPKSDVKSACVLRGEAGLY
eukprot:scaffold1452_cov96-Skeletonema_menzelii.AAC.6